MREMIKIYELDKMSKKDYERIMNRSQEDLSRVKDSVIEIINKVRDKGDNALVEFARRFDDKEFSKDRLRVNENDVKEAYEKTPNEVIEKIKEQISIARKFHNAQREKIRKWEKEIEKGILAGEKWTAIEEVGLYVPGGKNPFPTVAQILGVAAKTAECKRIIATISPKGDSYETIIALNECGIKEIYRASGAQAIAAMAYGTGTIKPVQLVAGPGSPWVTAAKIFCQEKIAIDMPAGPSEAVIIADESCEGIGMNKKAAYCAADILARAEHGADSAAVLVTNSMKLAELAKKEIEKQFPERKRKEYIKSSLKGYCAIIVVKSIGEAVDFANEYAPEHLEILTKNPRETFENVRNAGSVFLGMNNPVAAGDYASGVNHILPASGWAKRASAAGVWTFMKRVQYSELSRDGLMRIAPIIKCIAGIEGLDAHKESVNVRLRK